MYMTSCVISDIDGEDDDDDDDEDEDDEGEEGDASVGLSYLQKSGLEVTLLPSRKVFNSPKFFRAKLLHSEL